MIIGDPWFDEMPRSAKAALVKTIPTKEQIQQDWAEWLFRQPKGEQPSLVAAQVNLLAPINADPFGWCHEAMRMVRHE